MKDFRKSVGIYSLLWVFLAAFSSQAFAFSTETRNLDPRDHDYLQANQNNKGLFFEETDLNLSPEILNDKISGGSGLLPSGNHFSEHSGSSLPGKSFSSYLPNQRKLLEQQIFPFHFFL